MVKLHKPTTRTARFFCVVALSLFGGWVLSVWLANSFNSIYQGNNWISGKEDVEVKLYNSLSTHYGRAIVAGERLNLSPWYGFQEFYSVKTGMLKQFEFRFRMHPYAYVDVLFNKSKKSRLSKGLRLYANQDSKSFFFEMSAEGRFDKKDPIAKPFSVNTFFWNYLVVNYNSDSQSVRVYLNNTLIGESVMVLTESSVGLQGNDSPVEVDDIFAEFKDGSTIRDTFSVFVSWNVVLVHAVLLILLVSLLMGIVRIFFKKRIDVVHMSSGVVAFIVLLYSFDYFYLSREDVLIEKVYAEKRYDLRFIDYVEHARIILTRSWAQYFFDVREQELHVTPVSYKTMYRCNGDIPGCKVLYKKIGADLPGSCRVLIIGRSRATGSGAKTVQDAYYGHLYRKLKSRFSSYCNPDILTITTVDEDEDSLEHFKTVALEQFRPDFVIMDLMLDTDYNRQEFIKLRELIASDIPIVIMGNTLDKQIESVMSGKMSYIPVHEVLVERAGTADGVVFMDGLHLTSYGNSIAADLVFPFVEKEFQDKFNHKKK